MNARTDPATLLAPVDPLAKLREPFPDHQISKLPKESKAQSEQRKAEQAKGNWPAKCLVCGGLHHKNAVHLDYVGHAALTDRLLDTDPAWSWEPLAYRDGLPAFDATGGLWIKLTVCGVTRLGYGHAAAKPGQDPGAREKEIIGDALRNAAMRFGAALDLWHKGDLHRPEDGEGEPATASAEETAINMLRALSVDAIQFKAAWGQNRDAWKKLLEPDAYARVVVVMKACVAEIQERAAEEKAKAEPSPFDDEIPF